MGTAFGSYQTVTSAKMASKPLLSKIVSKVFGYTNVGNFARSLIFQKAIRTLPLDQIHEVLDLGCGFGEYSLMMAKTLPHAQVIGLELQSRKTDLLEKIAGLSETPNLRAHLGRIETLPSEQKFDLIYSVDVFEHILVAEMPFSPAFDRLRAGGYLLVKMPSRTQQIIAPESWFGEHKVWLDEEHIGQEYELEDLKDRFKAEGFEIVYAQYSDGWLARLGWEVNYFCRKIHPVLQLSFLPLAKLLVRLDNLRSKRERGNAILVIGRKS
jgi:SAM-dependent methyltransferase